MAKKKSSKKMSDEEGLEDEDDLNEEEDLEDEDVTDEDLEDELLGGSNEEESSETPEEEFFEEEEEIEIKDYKYLKAHIIEQHNNVYRIEFIDGSHGFLNYLSSHLLQDKNVRFSAYKATSLDPPVLTLIIEPDASVKKILESAINKMKSEIKELKEAITSSI